MYPSGTGCCVTVFVWAALIRVFADSSCSLATVDEEKEKVKAVIAGMGRGMTEYNVIHSNECICFNLSIFKCIVENM